MYILAPHQRLPVRCTRSSMRIANSRSKAFIGRGRGVAKEGVASGGSSVFSRWFSAMMIRDSDENWVWTIRRGGGIFFWKNVLYEARLICIFCFEIKNQPFHLVLKCCMQLSQCSLHDKAFPIFIRSSSIFFFIKQWKRKTTFWRVEY